jgi:Icc-related predicted phosphoesterase
MRIATSADIHGCWDMLDYPDADVLVIAGDLLNYYGHDIEAAEMQLNELRRFNDFLEEILKNKYKKIIIIAGNHGFCFERFPDEAQKILTGAIYLQDSGIEIDGVKFYGSPWQPWFWDWAFNLPNPQENFYRARAHARIKWDAIPSDTNVLITHGPPHTILDTAKSGQQVGCPYLLERIKELKKLKLHIFGHVHYSHGIQYKNKCLYVNATISPGYTEPIYPIRVINI